MKEYRVGFLIVEAEQDIGLTENVELGDDRRNQRIHQRIDHVGQRHADKFLDGVCAVHSRCLVLIRGIEANAL